MIIVHALKLFRTLWINGNSQKIIEKVIQQKENKVYVSCEDVVRSIGKHFTQISKEQSDIVIIVLSDRIFIVFPCV